jgi:hypothetical protein
MRRTHVLVVLLTGVVAVAAAAPVAMRVEVEPLRPVGDNTEVALVIQVAPMDRSRIGSNAIVRIELDEGRVSSGSPMRAVGAEDDGSFRVVVEWPPGEHDLRVTIEDPNREDTGLWVGSVRIPDLSPGIAVREVDEEQPESASASVSASEEPKPPASETPPSPEEIPSPAPEPTSETGPVETEAPQIDSSPEAEPQAEIEPPPPPVTEPEPTVEKSPSGPTAAAATAIAAATTPETGLAIPPVEPEIAPQPEPEPIEGSTAAPEPVPEPEPEVVTEPEPATTEPPAIEPEPDVAEETTVEAEPEPEVPEEALVEPLRADPPAEATVPETVEPSTPAEPLPLAAPVSADIASRYAEWEKADPETREFSIVAMKGRDSAQDLDAGALRLRIGGSDVAIEKLGDSESAPLLLGLAIDVESGDVGGWSGMQGSLAPITDRAGGGRGRLFVVDSTGVGDWGAESGSRDSVVGSRPAMNVAQQVVASLERFRGERGRTFLIVLTDGRGEPGKDDWQQANDAAGTAGVPVLVVALWDDKFSNKTRKNLKKLTVASGGSLFLVQGRSQLNSAADRFGRYLDGGHVVRFRAPAAGKGAAMAISVSATDREITITAPKSIR